VRFIVAAGLENIEQPILLVENNQDDVLLILRAFQRAGVNRRIQAVTSGMDALAYLQGTHPYDDREKYPLPALVLLDIKMPGMDGFEVLQWIRRQGQFFELCVVMLTNSDHISDANQAYHLGANSFLVKPLDFENAAELARSLDTVLAKVQH
jgi:CheY-like chemotaxis protein